MHFVPFPSLTEAERFAGLAPVASAGRGSIAVTDAVAASGITDATRVRLIQRSDGPVYVVSGPSRAGAVHASDGADASVASPDVALAIARDHADSRGLDAAQATIVARADYDQWSVPNGFDRHRPLFRVALGDAAGTEIYVSSRTGEIVLDTTRSERRMELGRQRPALDLSDGAAGATGRCGIRWSRHLSLVALIAAMLGAVLGMHQDQDSRGGLIAFALSRLARAASHHRARGDRFRAELDFQRLALHGSRPAVLRGGN